MSRNRIAVAVALGALVATGYAAHHGCASADAHPRVVLEDDPSWDCRTMGNGICGPGTVDHRDGSPVVAGQYRDGALVPWSQPFVPQWCADVCLGS